MTRTTEITAALIVLVFIATTSWANGIANAARIQAAREITEKNWQAHPRIVEIRKIVTSIDAGLKNGRFKKAERRFESCPDQYFTLRRLARDSKGAASWFEDYAEGEDSSWDYHYYYDKGHLRFVLVTVYAANGSREQHRAYFDETGKLIWQNRRTLKGPGYFAPQNIEELPKEDPNQEFADDKGCIEIRTTPKRKSTKTRLGDNGCPRRDAPTNCDIT